MVVLEGTFLDPKEKTLWEEIELQLTGKIEFLAGKVSPGREKLQAILSKKRPVLVLMDELLQYMSKAAGISVVDSNLATQSKAFL